MTRDHDHNRTAAIRMSKVCLDTSYRNVNASLPPDSLFALLHLFSSRHSPLVICPARPEQVGRGISLNLAISAFLPR